MFCVSIVLFVVPIHHVYIIFLQVHGPKGKFNISTDKVANDPHRVLVRYQPTDVGCYVIEVMWSEVPVPGSPFSVYIS